MKPRFLLAALIGAVLSSPGCSPCTLDAPDEDGDRLECSLELEAGTDPSVADSDGDGYLDGDEVAEGSVVRLST